MPRRVVIAIILVAVTGLMAWKFGITVGTTHFYIDGRDAGCR